MTSRYSYFEDAFEDLFTTAFRVANRILANRVEAEDVAAETMVRTLCSWRHVCGMAAPRGWVVRVAANLAKDTARRRRFIGRAVTEDRVCIEDIATRVALRNLLRRLPPRQREVLALRYVVDLSEVEIAAALGISPGSVKRHASRGLDALRRNDEQWGSRVVC